MQIKLVPDVCSDEEGFLHLDHHAGEVPGLAHPHVLAVQALHRHPVPLLYDHVNVSLH